MATRDEILALFPDNTVGAIDAADMRAAINAIWDIIDENEARISALENSGAGPSVSGIWQVNPTPGATPQAMQVSSDTGNVGPETTWLRFWKVDQNNTDFSYWLTVATSLYAQQQATAANWAAGDITGESIDGGDWIQLPVSVTDASGDGSAAWQAAVVVMQTAEA